MPLSPGVRLRTPGLLSAFEQIQRSGRWAPNQPFAQTLGPNIGPVLFDVIQTRGPIAFAVNHPPSGWNLGDRLCCSSSLIKTTKLPSASSNGLMLNASPDYLVAPDHLVDVCGPLTTILQLAGDVRGILKLIGLPSRKSQLGQVFPGNNMSLLVKSSPIRRLAANGGNR